MVSGHRDTARALTLITDDSTSGRMARQRRRDTRTELAVRRILHARGMRYRVDRAVPGMPRRRADLTFTRQRVVVFVDGCFWHVCPDHGTQPKRNRDWWANKLRNNVVRDRETDEHLARLGWTVVRVWEHEAPEVAADRVQAALTAYPARPEQSSDRR